MSIRTDHASTDASYAGAVRKDLETLKQTAVEAARLDTSNRGLCAAYPLADKATPTAACASSSQ